MSSKLWQEPQTRGKVLFGGVCVADNCDYQPGLGKRSKMDIFVDFVMVR